MTSLKALAVGPAEGDPQGKCPCTGEGAKTGQWPQCQSVPSTDRARLGLLSWAVASSSSGEDFFKKRIYLFAYGIKGTFSGLFLLLCDHWGGAPPLLAGHRGSCPSVSLSFLPGALSVLTKDRWQGGKGRQESRSGDSLLQPPYPGRPSWSSGGLCCREGKVLGERRGLCGLCPTREGKRVGGEEGPVSTVLGPP